MKNVAKNRLVAALVTVGLVAVVSVAMAGYNATRMGTPPLGGGYWQNASTGLRVDSLGKAMVVLGEKEADYFIKHRGIIQDSLAAGSSDSTRAPIAVFKASRGFLVISANMVSPNLFTTVRLAVSITGTYSSTYNADSSYTFDVGKEFTDFSTVMDTLQAHEMSSLGSPKATAIASTEYIVVLQRDPAFASTTSNRPTAISVPLVDRAGMWITAPYLNVKVRVINQTGAAAARRVPIRVDYFGYVN